MATLSFEPLTLPALPYEYDELEPVVSKEIMQLHHQKHHATYIANYNKALQEYNTACSESDIARQIALFQAMKFNGGGHINHSIFWTNLAPTTKGGGHLGVGSIHRAIEAQFGSFSSFQERFTAAAISHQGSGWCWLGYNVQLQRLEIVLCDNQDPLSTKGLVALLGIDVWEHAYYLQYKNVRAEYIKALWSIINWDNVQQRFDTATASRK